MAPKLQITSNVLAVLAEREVKLFDPMSKSRQRKAFQADRLACLNAHMLSFSGSM